MVESRQSSFSSTAYLNSPRELVRVLFRRRWIVLGIALPIILVGVLATLSTTDTYNATSQVLITARSVEDPNFRQMTVDYDALMSTATQIAKSIPVAEGAAELAYDEVMEIAGRSEGRVKVQTREGLRDLILRGLNCGVIGESNILSIEFSHFDQMIAYEVVNAVTESFLEYWVSSRQNPRALEYYTEQIATVEAEIGDLLSQRADIYDREGIRAMRSNNSAGIQLMRQMEYSYFQSRSDRVAAEERYNEVVNAIDKDKDYLPSLAHAADHSGLVGLRSEWEKAVLDLSRLKTTYTDSATVVRRQREFVQDAWNLFVNARDDFVNDIRSDLMVAVAKEQSLLSALMEYQSDLSAYPILEKQVSSIDVQITTRQELLEALLLKWGEVRLKAESDQRISNITQLNEPSVNYQVSGGKKIIYLVMASVFALMLGLVVALLVDVQDHRIFDRTQAEQALEVPVLGVITATKNPKDKT